MKRLTRSVKPSERAIDHKRHPGEHPETCTRPSLNDRGPNGDRLGATARGVPSAARPEPRTCMAGTASTASGRFQRTPSTWPIPGRRITCSCVKVTSSEPSGRCRTIVPGGQTPARRCARAAAGSAGFCSVGLIVRTRAPESRGSCVGTEGRLIRTTFAPAAALLAKERPVGGTVSATIRLRRSIARQKIAPGEPLSDTNTRSHRYVCATTGAVLRASRIVTRPRACGLARKSPRCASRLSVPRESSAQSNEGDAQCSPKPTGRRGYPLRAPSLPPKRPDFSRGGAAPRNRVSFPRLSRLRVGVRPARSGRVVPKAVGGTLEGSPSRGRPVLGSPATGQRREEPFCLAARPTRPRRSAEAGSSGFSAHEHRACPP